MIDNFDICVDNIKSEPKIRLLWE